jgi:hypothetical protein
MASGGLDVSTEFPEAQFRRVVRGIHIHTDKKVIS